MVQVRLLLPIALTCAATSSCARAAHPEPASTPVVEVWEGTLGPGDPTPIRLELPAPPTLEGALLALPAVGQAGIPVHLTAGAWLGAEATFEAQTAIGPIVFRAHRTADDRVAGDCHVKPLGISGRFVLSRAASTRRAFRIEEVSFRSDIALSGALLLPEASQKVPAVVILHGSGRENRSGGWFLGEQLAANGVAVLVYDKRGTGKSAGDWKTAGPEDLANDAAAAIALLAARPEVDPHRIGVGGGSQASWIAALALSRRPEVAFLFFKSGPLTTVAEEGHYDVEVKLERFSAEDRAEALSLLRLDDEVTRSGHGYPELLAAQERLRSRPWFTALGFEAVPAEDPARLLHRKWLDLDPVPLLRQHPRPTLWIYGGKDRTVPAQASAEIARKLQSAGLPFTVRMLPEADHAMLRGPPAGSVWPRLDPEYVPATLQWVLAAVQTNSVSVPPSTAAGGPVRMGS
jgi:pimeloyl-ACP methyl ester carboxylesterase